MMQIFAKPSNFGPYKTITLNVESTDLINDVKVNIGNKLRISQSNLQLYACGKILQDGNPLSLYNISKGATIEIFYRSIFTPSKQIGNVNNDNKDEVYKKFQDDLAKSLAQKTNKEVELRTKNFKEKHDENLAIEKKMLELEVLQEKNTKEIEEGTEHHQISRFLDRKAYEEAKQKKVLIDQNIKELQQESSNLENQMKAKLKKISDEEKAQFLKEQQKKSENDKIIKEIKALKQKKLKNNKEKEKLSNTDFEFNKKSSIVNEGLVDFISKSIEEKKKDLECPVCFEPAETPIYMCSSFHLICKACLPNIQKCSECRIKYPRTPVRHRFAEKLDQEMKKLCIERNNIMDGNFVNE